MENCIAAETLLRCGLGKREPAATALPAAVTVLAGGRGATQAGTELAQRGPSAPEAMPGAASPAAAAAGDAAAAVQVVQVAAG